MPHNYIHVNLKDHGSFVSQCNFLCVLCISEKGESIPSHSPLQLPRPESTDVSGLREKFQLLTAHNKRNDKPGLMRLMRSVWDTLTDSLCHAARPNLRPDNEKPQSASPIIHDSNILHECNTDLAQKFYPPTCSDLVDTNNLELCKCKVICLPSCMFLWQKHVSETADIETINFWVSPEHLGTQRLIEPAQLNNWSRQPACQVQPSPGRGTQQRYLQ